MGRTGAVGAGASSLTCRPSIERSMVAVRYSGGFPDSAGTALNGWVASRWPVTVIGEKISGIKK